MVNLRVQNKGLTALQVQSWFIRRYELGSPVAVNTKFSFKGVKYKNVN